jgi:UrcA family protein
MKSSNWSLIRVATLAVAGVLAAAGTTVAQPAGAGPRSVVVRYGDLDLQNPAAVQTLYRRIRFAAREVCGPAPPRELDRRQPWLECYRAAVAEAVAQTGHAGLEALHGGRPPEARASR